jgi:hypothetical protein
MLMILAATAELFHTPTGTAYADIAVAAHRETWPVRSQRFRAWLRRRYYEATGDAPSPADLGDALNLLEARAQFDGPEREIHVRLAEYAGKIYLDLADQRWRSVEIGPAGWQVVERPPVRFRRPSGMLALPEPEHRGSIEALSSMLNLKGRDELVLVTAWLLAALRHDKPYTLLVISGEQGSSKTMLAKMLRALIDPNVAPVRSVPREERDLFIAANNGHVLAFDNLSALPPWLSDALCRLASGGSFAVRQLYTDQDEVLFHAARPIILEDVVTRPDLADRAVFLTLWPISQAHRRPEQQLWHSFELEHPRLLGALLDAVSSGLAALPRVHMERLPRMADFAMWSTACETRLWPAGTFARAYAANRQAAIDTAIEADPVAAWVRELMAERGFWAGSAGELLRAGTTRGRDLREAGGWPKNPRALAGRLRRAQPFLRSLGIEIGFSREGRAGRRVIRMVSALENTVSTVDSVRGDVSP